jgi:hypothetical protein
MAVPVGGEQDRVIVISLLSPFDHADHHVDPSASREQRQTVAGGSWNGFGQARDTISHEITSGGAFGEENELHVILGRLDSARCDPCEIRLSVAGRTIHLNQGDFPTHNDCSPATAARMMTSSVAPTAANSATIRPRRITRIRSLRPRTSGSSDEIKMMPRPSSASCLMIA